MPYTLNGKFWTLEEIAIAEDAHRYTPYNWVRDGKLTAIRLGHASSAMLLVPDESYAAFKAERAQGGAQ